MLDRNTTLQPPIRVKRNSLGNSLWLIVKPYLLRVVSSTLSAFCVIFVSKFEESAARLPTGLELNVFLAKENDRRPAMVVFSLESSTLHIISKARPLARRAYAQNSSNRHLMQFSIPSRFPKSVLSVIAAHGATDVVFGKDLWPYLMVFVPVHGALITPMFFMASVLHFSRDSNIYGSVGFHGLLAVVASVASPEASFDLLLAYMCSVHLPRHFTNVAKQRQWVLAFSTAFLGAVALSACCPWDGVVRINHVSQRLVVSHVLCHLLSE